MYSPNGTGCRFAYRAPGPAPGVHTIDALVSWSAGSARTAPKSTGTPTVSTAPSMTARASASR